MADNEAIFLATYLAATPSHIACIGAVVIDELTSENLTANQI